MTYPDLRRSASGPASGAVDWGAMGMYEEPVGRVRWTFWPIATVVFGVAVFAWVVVDDLRRARAGDWPSCEGVLVERGTTPLRRGEEVRTDLKLRYTYKVGGVEYAGDRIAIGDMSYSLAADAKRELDELYPAGRTRG